MEAVESVREVELQIVVLGDSFVGKSSLIKKFIRDCSGWDLGRTESTLGVDFAVKKIMVDDYSVRLQIWDTAGQERFHSVARAYYRKADGVIIVYDVTNRKSFSHVDYWVNLVNKETTTEMIIVGNKIDLPDRNVTRAEGLQHSKEKGVLFMETSVMIGQGIAHVLEKLVRKVLQNGIPIRQPTDGRVNFFSETRQGCSCK